MTRLRDDGHLETDDSVVAACFIGQGHLDFNGANRGVMYRVARDCVISRKLLAVGYPILIPAKTVAEVCKQSPRTTPILIEATMADRTIFGSWLRKHTGEDK